MIERGDDLGRRLRAHGDALDLEIRRAAAFERVRRNVLGGRERLPGFSWQRAAAAILVAGVLGAAFDLMLPENAPEPFEVAAVAPLYAFDTDSQ